MIFPFKRPFIVDFSIQTTIYRRFLLFCHLTDHPKPPSLALLRIGLGLLLVGYVIPWVLRAMGSVVSIVMGGPHLWMVFSRENPKQKWMRTGGY